MVKVFRVITYTQSASDSAKEAMKRVWTDGILDGKTKLKIDYPG